MVMMMMMMSLIMRLCLIVPGFRLLLDFHPGIRSRLRISIPCRLGEKASQFASLSHLANERFGGGHFLMDISHSNGTRAGDLGKESRENLSVEGLPGDLGTLMLE